MQQAQATRKKAEARIRKMCEGASKVWKSTTQAVDTFVKKHEGTIKAAIGIGTIILTIIPATAPIGIVLGTTLSVASVNNAVTGKDWLTGRELGTVERVVDGVFGTVGTLTGTSTIAKQAVNTGVVDDALKLANSGLDSVKNALKPSTPAATLTPQSNGGSLDMNLQVFGGKGESVAGSVGKNVSGATDDFAKEPFLPDSYYKNNYASMDGTPNSKIEFERLGSSGNIEKSTVIYDQGGKQNIRIDYSDHGNSLHHTNPHVHEYEWFDGGKAANEMRYFLDDKGIFRLGEIDDVTNTIKFLD